MRRRKTLVDRKLEKMGVEIDVEALTGEELLEGLRVGADANLSVSVQAREAKKILAYVDGLKSAVLQPKKVITR